MEGLWGVETCMLCWRGRIGSGRERCECLSTASLFKWSEKLQKAVSKNKSGRLVDGGGRNRARDWQEKEWYM